MLSYFIGKPLMAGGWQPFPSPSKSEVSFGLKWRQRVEYLPKTSYCSVSSLKWMIALRWVSGLMFWAVGMGWILKKEPESHKDPIDKM